MNSTKLASIGLAAALTAILPAAPAQAAGVARSFLSAAGSDSNNCANVATPCRHMAAAFAATATNGEIYVLDPANYGSVTITHGVSIQGHGWGSIAPVSGGNGITISAPSTDVVNLDGLTIDGTALPNTAGIVFNSGGLLTVANCVVRDLGNGLIVGNSGTLTLALTVSNSYFNDNAGNGILLQPTSSGAIIASIDRTVLSGNGFAGLNLIGQFGISLLRATVTDSVAANNVSGGNGTGFLVQSAANQSVATLAVMHSSAIANSFGISAFGANTTLVVGQSTVTGNTTGYSASSGGIIDSYGDNNIFINGANMGSLSLVTKQ
jgi:hypothetical protein